MRKSPLIFHYLLKSELNWPTESDSRTILSTSNIIPTSRKGSHVYFLLPSFLGNAIVLSNCTIVGYVVLMLPCWPDVTIVQSDVTIVVPSQLSTGSKHDYLFCYCPPVGILFEVLRIGVLGEFLLQLFNWLCSRKNMIIFLQYSYSPISSTGNFK